MACSFLSPPRRGQKREESGAVLSSGVGHGRLLLQGLPLGNHIPDYQLRDNLIFMKDQGDVGAVSCRFT